MKRKMMFSLIVMALVISLTVGATLALFTSETIVEGNTLAAGKLELTVGNPTTKNFALANLFPGIDLDLADDQITNSGTLPYHLKAVISEDAVELGTGDGYLPDQVNLTVTLTGPNGEEMVYEDTLENLLDADLIWQAAGAPLVIEAAEEVSFTMTGDFDLAAGNDYQESEWEGTVTFTAVQSDAQSGDLNEIIWVEYPEQ